MAATTPGLQSQAKLRELKWSEPKNCYGKQQDRRHMQGTGSLYNRLVSSLDNLLPVPPSAGIKGVHHHSYPGLGSLVNPLSIAC